MIKKMNLKRNIERWKKIEEKRKLRYTEEENLEENRIIKWNKVKTDERKLPDRNYEAMKIKKNLKKQIKKVLWKKIIEDELPVSSLLFFSKGLIKLTF